MSVWGPGTRQVWGSTSSSLGLIMQDVWPSWLACNVVACGLPVPRTACLCPAQCWGLEVAGTLSSLQSAACSSLPAQGSLPHSATVISTQIIHRKLGTWSRLTATTLITHTEPVQKLYIKSHAKTQPAVTKIPLHWEISWWSRLFTVSCWLIAHSRGSWLPPATDVRCEAPKLLLTFRGFYNLILTKPIRETGRQWSSLSQLILYVTVAGDHKWLVSR